MFAFKRLSLAAAITFAIVTNVKTAQAAECWLRDTNETVRVPAGETLQPGGYVCVDHRGVYAQVEGGEREVRVLNHGVPRHEAGRPRVQARPMARMSDLLDAGIAYPVAEKELKQENRIAQHQAQK